MLLVFAVGPIFLAACNEPIEYLNELSTPSHTSSIDSSKFEHNISFNNHYFLLEFDGAYASIGPTYGRETEGCGPATIVFSCIFHDRYTGIPFRLIVNAGYSIHGDTNFRYYVTDEVQSRLDQVPEFFECQKYSDPCGYMGYGTKLQFGTGNWAIPQTYLNENGLDPESITGEIELLSYTTYMVGLDKYADFHFKFDGTIVKANITGKLRAQYK